MTGSGNDFVFLDGRSESTGGLDTPEAIGRLCSRTNGIGADGVVIIESHPTDQFAIRYYNRDGSRGELCGNASLCSSNLAVRLGMARPEGFRFSTDVGTIAARIVGPEAEIDLQPVRGLAVDAGIARLGGEHRMGYADTGVPHLVVLVADAERVDLMSRGSELRRHPSLVAGANVNFVSPAGSHWRMRTYERGVEGETLACGTGSVATVALLNAWGLARESAQIRTTSGQALTVTLRRSGDELLPSLKGEGRLMFAGEVVDL
jgi:diaminopimelate epimerase